MRHSTPQPARSAGNAAWTPPGCHGLVSIVYPRPAPVCGVAGAASLRRCAGELRERRRAGGIECALAHAPEPPRVAHLRTPGDDGVMCGANTRAGIGMRTAAGRDDVPQASTSCLTSAAHASPAIAPEQGCLRAWSGIPSAGRRRSLRSAQAMRRMSPGSTDWLTPTPHPASRAMIARRAAGCSHWRYGSLIRVACRSHTHHRRCFT